MDLSLLILLEFNWTLCWLFGTLLYGLVMVIVLVDRFMLSSLSMTY